MNKKFSILGLSVVLASSAFLVACNDDDDDNSTPEPTAQPLSLTLLHINDHHSHLQANDGSLMFNGVDTDVQMGGFPKVVAKIKELAASSSDPVLKLHAGDAVTGDLYYTLFKGQADADLMNEVCFDAFILGNHEFDDGDAGLKNFLDYLYSPLCQTPVLAANVVPEVGVSPLTPFSATDYIQPYIIKEINGEKVGIIGIDIANKTKNSSSPDATTEFLDETTTAQQYIDELEGQGVNKIILMTHYQYQNDVAMVGNLRGVDVIVGGDSHTLLGSAFDGMGLNPGGEYPTVEQDANGNTVCIVQAWQYSNVVGELSVDFDAEGNVTSCSGTPHLLLGNSFVREDANGDDVELTGSDRQEVLDIIAQTPELSIVTPDASASAKLAEYSDQVDELKNAKIGAVSQDLCLERKPGQGYSSLCDVSATSAHGSDITNIVALAFKTMSLTSDIAIQNGGGVRVDVPAGDYTIGDAYTLLPFANTLLELDMTGQEIVSVLEDAYDYSIVEGGSSGAYPYASGLRWDLDRSKAKGERFFNVEVKLKDETEWHAIDLSATYKVVTNNYIAGGKDGYTTFGDIPDEREVDTFLDYAQSFVDYVEALTEAGETVDKLPVSEYSTQNYYDENGELQQ